MVNEYQYQRRVTHRFRKPKTHQCSEPWVTSGYTIKFTPFTPPTGLQRRTAPEVTTVLHSHAVLCERGSEQASMRRGKEPGGLPGLRGTWVRSRTKPTVTLQTSPGSGERTNNTSQSPRTTVLSALLELYRACQDGAPRNPCGPVPSSSKVEMTAAVSIR